MISAAAGCARKSAKIDGLNMTYVDEGTGDPIVFLHGNPTSSYLWRNVMPHLQGMGRLVAPDLIGMGGSDKLPDSGKGSYRFVDHAKYLDGLFAHLGISRNVTLVLHDWGSALGFHWAHRHADSIKGIAFMEAIVRPLKWTDWPHASRPIFEGLRSAAGEEMVLEKNFFVERIFPGSVLREMSDEEMDHYRAPYLEAGESRRPTLTWPREIPIDGEPADVHEIVAGYSKWMPNTPFPKLFVNAEPGAILTGAQREFCRSWENLSEVTVKGSHFIQEDSPDEIGQAIRGWLGSVEDA